MQAKHIVVHGLVQGVGFRYFVQGLGRRLGLTGDVRNLPDSTVEIVVEGDDGKIKEFVKAVERGPSMAYVERLDIHDLAPSGKYHSFLVEGWR
jgi:acylphosphatase